MCSMLENASEINYNTNKIEYLYRVSEKALLWQETLNEVLDRLGALEKMHKDSPQIEVSIKNIKENQKKIQEQVVGQKGAMEDFRKTVLEVAESFKKIAEKSQ